MNIKIQYLKHQFIDFSIASFKYNIIVHIICATVYCAYKT